MTRPGAPDYGQCSYRFSALAQEWIFLSLANHNKGFIWTYFYRDPGVRTAHAEMFSTYLNHLPLIIGPETLLSINKP